MDEERSLDDFMRETAEELPEESVEQTIEGSPAYEPDAEPTLDDVPGFIDDKAPDGRGVNDGPSLPYPVVAFGSSAGGLQAIRDILWMLPDDTGMAFVLVPHLAADQVSHLKEITERYTRMPVRVIEDGQQPQPNHLHVLQPNQIVRLQGGYFVVSERNPDDRIPHTIDTFFRSLGEDLQGNAIGVVLSGADADGALGLKSIRGDGGLAIVQAPETAQHSSMPKSSIQADHVDLVIAPREIGTELARLARQFARPDLSALEKGKEIPSDLESYQRILNMLRTHAGLELRQYKQETIRRRVARRMMLLQMDTLADYVRFLQARSDELENLQEDVLIGVTRFFRDTSFWHSLATDILPAFFEGGRPQRPVRIWSAGCSTGEEVYSLAITFLEYMIAKGMDNALQIFGTDASEQSIEAARLAIYPESVIADVGPERLRRFFVKVDRGFQLSKRVRDLCIFAKQNLCTDPPFSHIDFLSCRNVLIYFNQGLQRQVMQTFHYSLESSGFLLLGTSETLREYDEWFSPIDRKNKIYTKIGSPMPGGFTLTRERRFLARGPTNSKEGAVEEIWTELELQRAADRVLLARFAPPGLTIDEQLNVIQVRGQTSDYVELASGSVSWNLLRIVRDELAPVVRDATEHALGENVPVSRLGVMRGDDGKQRQVQVDVLPLSQRAARNRCYMVLFRDLKDPPALQISERQFSPQLDADEKDMLIAQLRQDLSSNRYHLQSLIEERDARNQELVSANEEIQSANEELQSTNEELETTKEELQSANEELQTVNDELQQRNAVLTQTGNDLSNLLTSVNIPLLMLTENLEIRQFTPPMERLLNIRAADIGRNVSEIRLQLSVENIEPILRNVLETLGTQALEVQDRDGKWHLMRVRPYRTSDNKIEGLVLILVDIDELRSSQQGLREARDFANSIVASVPVPVVVLAADRTIRTANRSFLDLTQMSDREVLGRSLPELVKMKWGIDQFREKLDALLDAEAGTVMQFEHVSTTEDRRVLLVKGQALFNDGARVILLTMEDITIQRDAEQRLAMQRRTLEEEIKRTGETLARTQTELRDLAAHLLNVQEEERRRVARELHDDIAQRLTVLSMNLRQSADGEHVLGKTDTDRALADIEALSTDVRLISHRLHPAVLDDLGLVAALNALVAEFREREGMFATYIGGEIPEDIPQDALTAIYRVTQEALRNVAKHAGKTHVKVVLRENDSKLRLEVRDFGTGFDQDDGEYPKGLGLISMKERARIAGGTLTVQSELGSGTSVVMEVPLEQPR